MTKNNLSASLKGETINAVHQQRFAYASFHAAKRIAQRTSMDIPTLMSLLDSGVYVNIGQRAGSSRRHLLFFSPNDKFFYVAIQDERYGKIITVLPPAYHKNSAWKITPEQCQLAKQRYEAHIESMAAQSINRVVSLTTPPVLSLPETRKSVKYRTVMTTKRTYKVLVQALYICESLTPKRRTLFKMSVDYYIDDFKKSIGELLQDPALYADIDNGIQKRRLFQGSIYALSFRDHKDMSVFHILTLRCRYDAEDLVQQRQQQCQRMAQVLLPYYSPYLMLPAPASMALLRVSWHRY